MVLNLRDSLQVGDVMLSRMFCRMRVGLYYRSQSINWWKFSNEATYKVAMVLISPPGWLVTINGEGLQVRIQQTNTISSWQEKEWPQEWSVGDSWKQKFKDPVRCCSLELPEESKSVQLSCCSHRDAIRHQIQNRLIKRNMRGNCQMIGDFLTFFPSNISLAEIPSSKKRDNMIRFYTDFKPPSGWASRYMRLDFQPFGSSLCRI